MTIDRVVTLIRDNRQYSERFSNWLTGKLGACSNLSRCLEAGFLEKGFSRTHYVFTTKMDGE